MIVIGLTGSIAMGKSETARMFAQAGIPVFDSDAAVHRLYAKGGVAVEAIERLVPDAVIDGAVDRSFLAQAVRQSPKLLKAVEDAVHPWVRTLQTEFLDAAQAGGAEMAVLDIPLLFETGRECDVDKVVVVSTSPDIQKTRALARPGMTQEQFDFILSRQLPDREKRVRADYVVDTSVSLDDARRQVDAIVSELMKNQEQSP